MYPLAPRSALFADPPLPKALAPAWARVAIGAAAGASLAPVLLNRRPFDVDEGWTALFVGLLALCAALAADLDRRRPRLFAAAAIAAVYELATALLIGGGREIGRHPLAALLLAFGTPFAAGLLRARLGDERHAALRGLVCFAFTLAFLIAGSLLAIAADLRIAGAELALAGAIAGGAATAGLVAAGWGLRESWPVAAARGGRA